LFPLDAKLGKLLEGFEQNVGLMGRDTRKWREAPEHSASWIVLWDRM